MTREEFIKLHQQYSRETVYSSAYFVATHPAYQELMAVGFEAIPWALERLEASLWKSNCNITNDIKIIMHLLDQLSNGECVADFPQECYGILFELRDHILKWGKDRGFI
jgi:hypothetical protein